MKKKLIALILCLALALASLAAIPAPGIDTDESAVMFNVAEEIMEEETEETEEEPGEETEEPGYSEIVYRILECETLEEALEILNGLTEEEEASITDEEWNIIFGYLDLLGGGEDDGIEETGLFDQESVPPTVSFTNVAPFGPPVTGGGN